MREELQRWLDGEVSDAEIPAELRPEAERLRALLDTPRVVGPAPGWLEQRVMADLPAHRPGRVGRAVAWLIQPKTVRVRPATLGALAAAALAALILWPTAPGTPDVPGTEPVIRTAATPDADGRIPVQFVYVAPDAGSVTVAGDFNDWDGEDFGLTDPDGDGVWTGQMRLAPGLHKYMFVVDGQWVSDPLADRYVDDGFGNRNALINVTPSGSSI